MCLGVSSVLHQVDLFLLADCSRQSKAFLERLNGKTSHSETQVGNGIQRCDLQLRLIFLVAPFSSATTVAPFTSRNFSGEPLSRFSYLVVHVYCYVGYLVSVDAYMNLQLANTEEFIDGQFTGNLGEVLIRCNNVLFMRGAPEEEEAS